ncbi:MAG: hypothetical protein IIC97_09270, partial [Chloroflexi bacterium]|nr:hypothetical protein [Chloroflexota bacterium]
MIQLLRPNLGMLLGGLLLFLLAACTASATSTPLPIPPTSTPFPAGPEVGVIIISTDLAVGTNRVIFGLVDREGMPVRATEAQVQAEFVPPGQTDGEVRDTATARFQRWPGGLQGVFT